MPSIDVASLIAVLLEQHLLDGPAEAALPELSQTCARGSDLVAELVRRRWLTQFQAELILAGRAAELVIEDRYILLDKLGQGGMGAVYKARHRTLKAVRAVKVIHPDRLTGPNAVRRFFQEVEAVGKLFHPNIILPHDAGSANGVYWLAMEYVPGADLGRLLDRGGPLPAADACEYIRQGGLALQHAHERGLVHRDIKPANLLVSSADGRVKLLDLGLARVRALEEEGVGPQTALTQAGAMMGTPDYMAPEQAVDSHSVDIRADIYGLGCTLYHVLAGQPPFPGGSALEKIVKHRTQEAQPLEKLRNDLPTGLTFVIRKAMAKSPESRYQTPNELSSALAPFCASASPARPRPAGASGEHPILPATPRPSLAPVSGSSGSTIQGKSGRHRVPSSPGKLTVTLAPEVLPSATARTVTSVETPLDSTVSPLTPQPTKRPGQRRTSWLAVFIMVAVGVLSAIGVRYLLSPARKDASVESLPPPTSSALPQSVPPVVIEPAPAADNSSEPPPLVEKVRPAVARNGGNLANEAALTRSGRGDLATAAIRPAAVRMREQLYRLKGDSVRAIAISAGGKWAAVVANTNLDIYDLSRRGTRSEGPGPLDQLAPGLSEPSRVPNAVAVSPDGRHAYLTTTMPGATDARGKTKGPAVNAVVHYEYQQSPGFLYGPPLQGIDPEYLCVGVSPDGNVLAAGTIKTGDASWWNGAVKPPRLREFKHGAGSAVTGLAFSADGKRVLFCSRDGDLCLQTIGMIGSTRPLMLKGHAKGAQCAAFAADGQFAISGGLDGKVCVWDFTGPPPAEGFLTPAKELSWHRGEVKSVAFAPAGDRFLSGGEDGYICLGEVSRSDMLLRVQPEGASAQVLAVAFSGDSAYALYATHRSIGRYLLQPLPFAESRSGESGSVPRVRAQ